MSNKIYYITMPFTGIATREIEAESEEAAIEKFMDETTFPTMTQTADTDCYIQEWEFAEQVVQGNLFNGIQNEVSVHCDDEDEENEEEDAGE